MRLIVGCGFGGKIEAVLVPGQADLLQPGDAKVKPEDDAEEKQKTGILATFFRTTPASRYKRLCLMLSRILFPLLFARPVTHGRIRRLFRPAADRIQAAQRVGADKQCQTHAAVSGQAIHDIGEIEAVGPDGSLGVLASAKRRRILGNPDRPGIPSSPEWSPPPASLRRRFGSPATC